ncbi:hypothetical protein HFP15_19130 [Amycolatopsis sp. K13G38]|uniref:Glycosyltransferase family 39 protein n=1 Tax=Amycolatopsis acididurans TaxID=2724524 RepID=A0ABX1J7X6_9PSEU|nr:hypothetical protein [Amycolatopsis acididurans]NKQ54999.1 hypothetical protein [Amycolatopsis acididurans]
MTAWPSVMTRVRAGSTGGARRLDPVAWSIAGLAVVAGLAFLGVNLAYNGGRLVAPLDDVYIHLQYGSQIGLGHFFQYNTGDQVSTGASSLLYALILGAASAVGFTGNGLLGFAVGFGIACFAATAGLTCVLGTRVVARPVGIWAGLLVAVSGPLLWGSSSGMEVGLVMLLVVAMLLTFRSVSGPFMGVLLALSRPEGLIFAAALTFAAVWVHRRRPLRAVLSLLPLVAGAAQLVFYRIATGSFSANGIQAKSFFDDRPVFYFSSFLDRTAANLHGFLGTFLAFTEQDYAFPGALVVFLVGVLFVIFSRPPARPMVIATGIGLACVLVSVSTLNTALIHELRYIQPFMPVFILFAVAGVYAATRVVAQPRARRLALHAALAVALAFSLVSVPTWAARFGRDAATIRDTDVSVALWLKEHIPGNAVVAVKDVGAVAYLSGHRVVDVIGLATNGLAEAANNGPGAVYEALRHLPPAQRPTYFAVYNTVPGPDMTTLRDAGVLAEPPLQTFTVQAPPDLTGERIVPFTELNVYRADWSVADKGDQQPVPGSVRDYVNVGDLKDEKAHDYQPHQAQDGTQPWTAVAHLDGVVDSGRDIVGGESFTVRGLTPGRQATLTARTAVTAPTEATNTTPLMQVLVNGVPVSTWNRPHRAGAWSTYTFTMPASAVTSDTARIDVVPRTPLLNPYPVYTSFGYWVSQ